LRPDRNDLRDRQRTLAERTPATYWRYPAYVGLINLDEFDGARRLARADIQSRAPL
jgi:hypothetical protein